MTAKRSGSFSGAEDELASDGRERRIHLGHSWANLGLPVSSRSGGFEDPLGVYEATFSEIGDQPEAWRRVADKVALRFPDPDGRRDAAGRVIPHDFVLLGPWADGINSLEDGRQRIWHEVADEFESVWDKTEPPSARGDRRGWAARHLRRRFPAEADAGRPERRSLRGLALSRACAL